MSNEKNNKKDKEDFPLNSSKIKLTSLKNQPRITHHRIKKHFGTSINELLSGDFLVPQVLTILCQYLTDKGIDSRNLLQERRNETRFQEFFFQWNLGNFCDPEDPIIAFHLLRQWLQELPEPLFPGYVYNDCMDIVSKYVRTCESNLLQNEKIQRLIEICGGSNDIISKFISGFDPPNGPHFRDERYNLYKIVQKYCFGVWCDTNSVYELYFTQLPKANQRALECLGICVCKLSLNSSVNGFSLDHASSILSPYLLRPNFWFSSPKQQNLHKKLRRIFFMMFLIFLKRKHILLTENEKDAISLEGNDIIEHLATKYNPTLFGKDQSSESKQTNSKNKIQYESRHKKKKTESTLMIDVENDKKKAIIIKSLIEVKNQTEENPETILSKTYTFSQTLSPQKKKLPHLQTYGLQSELFKKQMKKRKNKEESKFLIGNFDEKKASISSRNQLVNIDDFLQHSPYMKKWSEEQELQIPKFILKEVHLNEKLLKNLEKRSAYSNRIPKQNQENENENENENNENFKEKQKEIFDKNDKENGISLIDSSEEYSTTTTTKTDTNIEEDNNSLIPGQGLLHLLVGNMNKSSRKKIGMKMVNERKKQRNKEKKESNENTTDSIHFKKLVANPKPWSYPRAIYFNYIQDEDDEKFFEDENEILFKKGAFIYDQNSELLNHDLPYFHKGDCCEECGTKFTLLVRSDHCMYCGRILCSTCCSRTSIIPSKIVQQGDFEQHHTCLKCEDHLVRHFKIPLINFDNLTQLSIKKIGIQKIDEIRRLRQRILDEIYHTLLDKQKDPCSSFLLSFLNGKRFPGLFYQNPRLSLQDFVSIFNDPLYIDWLYDYERFLVMHRTQRIGQNYVSDPKNYSQTDSKKKNKKKVSDSKNKIKNYKSLFDDN
ncbi:rabenosyn-5 [Anaeramoeba ignava]|uniref:Rabenosyn-5 n=1 Tax=Anaeramoeba ignava TaxID=1746090 RepID=A0A9Q0RE36_ANAIG|nr:rabenosyn-5 [Anaeramoeba ignava]